jgi:hypothetical protein
MKVKIQWQLKTSKYKMAVRENIKPPWLLDLCDVDSTSVGI